VRHLAAWVLCFIVSGTPVRVLDGDTFVASVDLWPGLFYTVMIRVLDVDTPEMKGETRAAGEAARAFAKTWLEKDDVLLAVGCGRPAADSFGRYLATVSRNGENLAELLIKSGHGVKR
jgi:endonuclease YncB( thermonuclease family)